MSSIYELNQPPNPLWDFIASLENSPFTFGPQMNSTRYQDGPDQPEAGEGSHRPGNAHPETQGGAQSSGPGHSQEHGGWPQCGFHPGTMPFGSSPLSGAGLGSCSGFGFPHWGLFGGGPRGPFSHRGRGGPHHSRGPSGAHRAEQTQGPDGAGAGTTDANMGMNIHTVIQTLASHLGIPLDQILPNQPQSQVDFTPPIDIITTPAQYIIHISLPGAKKEDLSVDYDSEESTLRVAGVVYRPGVDEEMHRGLVVAERAREVGVFEREVRLGTREDPARVVVEEIEGRLEEGVLRVFVPRAVEEREKGKKVVVVDDAEMAVDGEKENNTETLVDMDKGNADSSSDGREYVRVDVQ